MEACGWSDWCLGAIMGKLMITAFVLSPFLLFYFIFFHFTATLKVTLYILIGVAGLFVSLMVIGIWMA
jgi:hypothetical protein